MKGPVVRERHAVADEDVVPAGTPVLRHRPWRPEDLHVALRRLPGAAAQREHFVIAQRPVPQRHVIDLSVKAGEQRAVLEAGPDQEGPAERVEAAVRPVLVQPHAVDEHLELRPVETHHDVEPAAGADEFDGHLEPQHAVDEVPFPGRCVLGFSVRDEGEPVGRLFAREIVRVDALLERRRPPEELDGLAFTNPFPLREPDRAFVQRRRIENLAERVARRVPGKQRRRPRARGVPEPDAEGHPVTAEPHRPGAGIAGDQVTTFEMRDPAVTAAAQRRLALGPGELDAERHIALRREPVRRPGAPAVVAHVPDRGRIRKGRGVACFTWHKWDSPLGSIIARGWQTQRLTQASHVRHLAPRKEHQDCTLARRHVKNRFCRTQRTTPSFVPSPTVSWLDPSRPSFRVRMGFSGGTAPARRVLDVGVCFVGDQDLREGDAARVRGEVNRRLSALGLRIHGCSVGQEQRGNGPPVTDRCPVERRASASVPSINRPPPLNRRAFTPATSPFRAAW